jgi:hypothetical protein
VVKVKSLTPRARRLLLYAGIGAFNTFIVWQLADQNVEQDRTIAELHNLIQSEAHEDVVEDADACIRAYAGREDSRDMAEKTYRRNAETLTGFATSADPERIQAYAAQVERDVAEIRAELPDPDCDLDDARVVMEQEK